MKRISLYIFEEILNRECLEKAMEYSRIYLCDYINNEEIECCDECAECKNKCLFISHIKDKDVRKHIKLKDEDIEYPCIVCFANTYYKDEQITICSISDAKEYTKYGYNNDF